MIFFCRKKHYLNPGFEAMVLQGFSLLTIKLKKIMEGIEAVQAEVVQLKVSVGTLTQKLTDYETAIEAKDAALVAKNAELETANAALKTANDGLTAEKATREAFIADLQAQIAAGQGATPAQLQELLTSLTGIQTTVDSVVVPAV